MAASKSKGWIKIDREITEHWIFQDAEYFRAWMLMLLMANHEEHTILIDKKPEKIPAGAFHSSLSILAGRLGWSRNRVLRYTQRLEMDAMLTTKRTAHGTTFFIVNWPKYQGGRNTCGTTDGITDGASRGASDGIQTRMIKNDKEGKEARKRASSGYRSVADKIRDMEAMVAGMEEE